MSINPLEDVEQKNGLKSANLDLYRSEKKQYFPQDFILKNLQQQRAEVLSDIYINSAAISAHIKDPEKAREYRSFAEVLVQHLPTQEQQDFAENPITFTSSELLFRGFSNETYKDLQAQRHYMPQSGQLGGEAVYCTNCPFSVFHHQKGVVAVLPKSKLNYKTPYGLVVVGSTTYQKQNDDYLASIDDPADRKEALYTMDNRWDLVEKAPSANPNDQIISLRSPQPIEATSVFVLLNNGTVKEEFPSAADTVQSADQNL